MLRVEDKYVLSKEKMFLLEKRIEQIMELDPAANGEAYKISSLYFDDIYDSLLNASLDGVDIRDKYRIRIYNDSLKTIKLEVKRKTYNRAKKITSRISEEELRLLMAGQCIDADSDNGELGARTLFNLMIKTRGLRPKVIVTYDRKAYIEETGNVRVTFDRNLRASNQVDLFGQDMVYDYPDDTDSVLEVKYDSVIPRYIMQTLENSKMNQTANSKYVKCREIYR